jgi:hypothetical protein
LGIKTQGEVQRTAPPGLQRCIAGGENVLVAAGDLGEGKKKANDDSDGGVFWQK